MLTAGNSDSARPTSPMQGRRITGPSKGGAFVFGEDDFDYPALEPGDYAVVILDRRRQLWFRDPFGYLGRAGKHTLTEHDDGTVTLEPSILDERGAGEDRFHGWLREGVWTW